MNIHRFLFYLLLALLTTQLTKYFFPEFAFVSGIRVDYLAPAIYATDILIIGMVLAWMPNLVKKIKSNLLSRKLIIVVIVCLIGIAFNLLFAINSIVAFLKWLRILEALFITLYIVFEKPPLKTASIFLIIGGLCSCILAWLEFIQQSSVGGIFWWIGERTFTISTPGIARLTFNNQLFLRPYASFPHPNVLAGFLTSLIPLAFYIKNASQYTKLLFIPIIILFLSTILITFSQIAWVVALCITIIFVLKEKQVMATKLTIAVALLATFALISMSYQFVEKESVNRRVALTNNALSIIREHLLLGVGLNNFILANQQQTVINSYQDLQPVHSVYLLFISETGTVGVLLTVLILSLLYKKIRINNTSLYFIWSLGALFIFGLFDHYPLSIHQTVLLGSILTGFIFSSSRMVKF